MIKKILSLVLVFSLSISAAEQAITQWVYNTLERAQANLDKGNLEAAERIYYDYANDTWSSRSYDHFLFRAGGYDRVSPYLKFNQRDRIAGVCGKFEFSNELRVLFKEI